MHAPEFAHMDPKKGQIAISQIVPGSQVAGTLDEFILQVFGKDRSAGEPLPMGVAMGVEKFRLGHGRKYYRLIWMGRGKASWLAAERPEEFQRKGDAVLAGRELAESTGAYFDERTR
jgi:hypothetical protein